MLPGSKYGLYPVCSLALILCGALLSGYYCPSLWGGTTQFVCPAVRLMGSVCFAWAYC